MCLIWVALHIPGIRYGAQNVPLHEAYLTSDEQSPINGALHILQNKNPLTLRSNGWGLYYGPIFAVVAVPPVVADFAIRILTHSVTGAESYKDFIVWNWGGVLEWSRLLSVLVGFLGLLAVFLMFGTATLNPSRKKWIQYAASTLLGLNYLYFEYANFFRHWVFILAIVLWQLYLLILMIESDRHRKLFWFLQWLLTVLTFGISYIGIAYEILWLPLLIIWIKNKEVANLKALGIYVLGVAVGVLGVILWYPYGFTRMLSIVGFAAPTTHTSAVLDLTSSVGGHSFWFYAQIILLNDPFLLIAGITLAFALYRSKIIFPKYWLWATFLLAFANYTVFALPTHHETRYALPTIVFCSLMVMSMYSWVYANSRHTDLKMRLARIFLIFSIVVSSVQIIGWERMIMAGPVERRSIVPELVAWQKVSPTAKFLAFKDWPFGYVHTHDAYVVFANNHGQFGYPSDLWQYILGAEPPQSVTPIAAYYRSAAAPKITAKDRATYAHIITFEPAILDPQVWGGNPNDQFDFRPWTVWNYSDYQDRYIMVK